VTVLNDRMKHVGQLNLHIADWLQVCVVPDSTMRPLTATGAASG